MSKPIVAVVGRPNVGKSTLFNALAGEERAIVQDTPGVTRDRLYADCEWLGHSFTLIDTGGIEPDTKDVIFSQMRVQAEIAIETADVILFMTDLKQGVVDSDFAVADLLRRASKPVLLVVNKVDNYQKQELEVYEFYNLGMGDPIPISASGKTGIGDLLDVLVKNFPEGSDEEEEDDRPKIAIVGKPNVGKSSLVNRILGENRLIVSDIAGTTRDSIDTDVIYNEKEYVFIDTAGVRRKNKVKDILEKYMVIRAVRAIERADVVLLVIDAETGITEQDAKIAGLAHEAGKGILILVNKWDAIPKTDKTLYAYQEDIRKTLPFLYYAEILTISAKTGLRIDKLFTRLEEILDSQTRRVSTGVLNEILAESLAMHQPPTDKGKALKIYYMTQVGVKPPTFVVFVNDKNLMHFTYLRYIENQLRQVFEWKGTPLRFLVRQREKNKE